MLIKIARHIIMGRKESEKPITQETFPRIAVVAVILVGAIVAGCTSEVGNNQTPAPTQDRPVATETVKSAPNFQDVTVAVERVFGKQLPDVVAQRLAACDGKVAGPSDVDPTSFILQECARLGESVRDRARDAADQKQREKILTDLQTIEYFTYGLVDQFAAEDKIPNIVSVEGTKARLKADSFMP